MMLNFEKEILLDCLSFEQILKRGRFKIDLKEKCSGIILSAYFSTTLVILSEYLVYSHLTLFDVSNFYPNLS